MISQEFLIERHPDYGELGFRPKFMEDGDAFGPMALAHDILEHTPEACRVGGAEGEFMATGAMTFVRFEGHFWSRFQPGNVNPPEAHMSSDFADIFRKIEAGEQTLKDPGVTRKCRHDTFFWKIIRTGFKNCRDEKTKYPKGAGRRLLGWMRRGYRSAVKRYKGYDPYTICRLFSELEFKAAQVLRNVDFEGQAIRATVSLARGEAYVRTLHDYEAE